MTKKTSMAAFLVALFLTAPPAVLAGDMPAAEGRAVIDYLNRVDYTTWEMWPEKERLYKGQHPHGALLSTYVNQAAAGAIQEMTGTFPAGSIIVKENYSPQKELAAVTVMYRIEGYNPDKGDWFWLKYGPDGKLEAEGKVAGCINCHKAVKNNDWVFTGPVR